MQENVDGDWVKFDELAALEVGVRAEEKARRIYYQGIVYDVCNLIDRANEMRPGHGIVCGTKDTPSRQTQEALAKLLKERDATIAKLREQMTTDAGWLTKLREQLEAAQATVSALKEEQANWQEGRRQGREEALSMLMREDAETFEGYQTSSPLADTGDYIIGWDEDKLRGLFHVDTLNALVESEDGNFWEMMAERDAATARAETAEKDSVECRRWIEQYRPILADAEASRDGALAIVETCRTALAELASGVPGRFSRDRLEHASNCLEASQKRAAEALALLPAAATEKGTEA